MTGKIKILLLGGGYTLQTLIKKIEDPSICVITSRNAETCNNFKLQGYNSYCLDIKDNTQVKNFLDSFSDIKVVVDSIPAVLEDIEIYLENLSALASFIPYSIYYSTTGVIGKTDGSWVNEFTPPTPLHKRARIRYKTENHHQSIFNSSCTLRLPAIYGPGRGAYYAIKNQKYFLIDNGQRFTNRIHVDDLCNLTIKLISRFLNDLEVPKLICVNDDHPATQLEIAEYFCAKYNLAYPQYISLEEAINTLDPNMLLNQRVDNSLMKKIIEVPLNYPSFKLNNV